MSSPTSACSRRVGCASTVLCRKKRTFTKMRNWAQNRQKSLLSLDFHVHGKNRAKQTRRRRTPRKNVRRKQQANQGKMRREENLFLVVLARGVLLWGIPFHSAGHKEKYEQGTAGGGRESGRERGLTYNCLFHLFSSGLFLVKTFQHMGGRERAREQTSTLLFY